MAHKFILNPSHHKCVKPSPVPESPIFFAFASNITSSGGLRLTGAGRYEDSSPPGLTIPGGPIADLSPLQDNFDSFPSLPSSPAEVPPPRYGPGRII